MPQTDFDVIIVGGSAAGLSAALVLGRSRRSVLVLDAGEPCNAPAPHSHNFLTNDGVPPAEILNRGRTELGKYETVVFKNDRVETARLAENGFRVETETGAAYASKKIILAMGVHPIFPAIEGLEACWGKSVIHCPYCHGYEFKDQPTALLLEQKNFLHYLSSLYNLSRNVVLLTNGPRDFSEKQLNVLKQYDLKVIKTPLKSLLHNKGDLEKIVFNNEQTLEVAALYAPLKVQYNNGLAYQLGCDLGAEGFVKRNGQMKTNVPGVLACGDVSGAARSVAVAVASGNLAGISANEALCSENF